MGFFDPVPTRPQPTPPNWLAPPVDLVGSMVPLQRVIARTRAVVIALTGLVAYPTGCQFTLTVAADISVLGHPARSRLRAAFGLPTGLSYHDHQEPSPFRCGMAFGDGTKATSLDEPPLWDPTAPFEPRSPVFVEQVNTGTIIDGDELSASTVFWLWPLPPPEPLTLAVEWPAADVPPTATELDGGQISSAAQSALPCWPADGSST